MAFVQKRTYGEIKSKEEKKKRDNSINAKTTYGEIKAREKEQKPYEPSEYDQGGSFIDYLLGRSKNKELLKRQNTVKKMDNQNAATILLQQNKKRDQLADAAKARAEFTDRYTFGQLPEINRRNAEYQAKQKQNERVDALLRKQDTVKNWQGKNAGVISAEKKQQNMVGADELKSIASKASATDAIGQYGKGNIDLWNRPVVKNGDGSVSTVKSFSTNIDGKEVLLPLIVNGKEVSEEEAIQHYLDTGEYLGKFDSIADADAYGRMLHNQQEALYGSGAGGNRFSVEDVDADFDALKKTQEREPLTGKPFDQASLDAQLADPNSRLNRYKRITTMNQLGLTPDPANIPATVEWISEMQDLGLLNDSDDPMYWTDWKIQHTIEENNKKIAEIEARNDELKEKSQAERDEEVQGTYDLQQKATIYKNLADYGVPISWGPDQYFFMGSNVEESHVKERPEDYWQDGRREEYDRGLYDYINGEGTYDSRIRSMTTEDEQLALDAEMDQLWSAIEDGSIRNMADQAIGEYTEDAAKYGVGTEELYRQNEMLEDLLDQRLTQKNYMAMAEGGDTAYHPEAIKTNEVADNAYTRMVEAEMMGIPFVGTSFVGGKYQDGDEIDKIYFDVNNPFGDLEGQIQEWKYDGTLWENLQRVSEAYFMTPEQKDAFNSLYNAGKKEEAKAFYDALNRSYLSQMKMNYREDTLGKLASGKEGWQMGLYTIFSKMANDTMATYGSIRALLGDKEYQDKKNPIYQGVREDQIVRNNRIKAWGNKFAEWFGEDARGTGEWLGEQNFSLWDNVFRTVVSAGFGGSGTTGAILNELMMGNEVFGESMYEALSEDKSLTESFVVSLGRSLVESLTEHMGWDALFDADIKDVLSSGWKFAKYLGMNFASEAAEEATSHVMDTLLDEAAATIWNHRSELMEKMDYYMKQEGLTQEEASNRVWTEWLEEGGLAALGGGLTGLLSSGGYAGMARASYGSQTRQLGRDVLNRGLEDLQQNIKPGANLAEETKNLQLGNLNTIIDASSKLGENTESRKTAESIQNDMRNGKEIDLKKVGELVRNIGVETSEEIGNIAKNVLGDTIKGQLTEKGVKANKAGALSDTLVRLITGDYTEEDLKMLVRSKEAQSLLAEYGMGQHDDQLNELKERTKEIAETRNSVMEMMVDPKQTARGITEKAIGDLMKGAKWATAEEITAADAAGGKTGKAAEIIHDGKYAEITGFGTREVTEDGKKIPVATVTLSNGKTVDLTDIRPTRERQAQILQFVQSDSGNTIMAETGKALMQIGGKVQNIASAVTDTVNIVFDMFTGKQNTKTKLDTATEQEIRAAVQKDMDAADAARLNNYVELKPGQGKTTFKGVVYGSKAFDETLKAAGFSKSLRNEANAIASISKSLGTNVELYYDANESGNQGAFYGGQGIRINLAGTYNSEGVHRSALATFAHEVTHNLEANSAEAYKGLRRFVLQNLGKMGMNLQGELRRIMKNYAAHNENINLSGAVAEIVAMGSEQVLTNENVVRQLKEEDPSLFGKVKGAVQEMMNRIRMARNTAQETSSRYAKALQAVNDQVGKVWLAAAKEAQGAKGVVVGIGTAQNAFRDEEGNEIAFTEEIKNKNRNTVAASKPIIEIDQETIDRFKGGDLLTKGAEYFDEIGRIARNNALGNVELANSGLRHWIGKGDASTIKARTIPAIKAVIEKGEVVHIDNQHKGKPVDTAVVAGKVKMPDGQYYVGVIVAQDNGGTRGQKNRYSFHNAIVIKEGNSEGSMVYTAEAADSVTSSAVSSVISILRDIEKRNSQKSIQEDQDQAYAEAVERGDWREAERMLLEKMQKTPGITGYNAPHFYAGEHKDIAKMIKNGDAETIQQVVEDMAPRIPDNAVLIPMPPHEGKVLDTTDTYILANALSKATGAPVIKALESDYHESRYKAKTAGDRSVNAQSMGFRQVAEIPEGKMPVFIDNMVGGGQTAMAAKNAIGRGITLAYAQSSRSKSQGVKFTSVTYDENGKLIPLSQRMDPNNKSWKYSLQEQDEKYSAAVKAGNMDAAQRMVDISAERALKNSKMRTPDGKLRKLYHGTWSDTFYEFDPELIGTAREGDVGFFGRGFYFAYTRGEAEMYGSKNVMEVYLDIQKPFNYTKELYWMKGERTHDYLAGRAVFITNFAEKFPELANDHFVRVAEKGSDEYKEISLKEFAEQYKKIVNGTKFKVEKLKTYNGTEWQATADLHEVSYTDSDGETHKWMEYGYQKRFYSEEDAKNQLANAYYYLAENVYDAIDIQNPTTIIQETDFSSSVRKRGYDGVIQSEDGDEAVVFDSSQIKLADPVTYDDQGNVIPLSERFNDQKKDIRYSIMDDEFGYTNNINEAGYLLPDGRMLNFSGGQRGRRTMDHRDIDVIYGDDGPSGTDALIQFMNEGNIRIMPEAYGIDIGTEKEPTEQQYNQIQRIARHFAGDEEFNVDLSDKNGDNVGSLNYEGKINPTRIVNDIKHYFQTGEVRETNTLDRFRYSFMDETDVDARAWMETVNENSLQTEAEKQLLRNFKSLRMRVSLKKEQEENIQKEIRRLKDVLNGGGEGAAIETIENALEAMGIGIKYTRTARYITRDGAIIGKMAGRNGVRLNSSQAAVAAELEKAGFGYDKLTNVWTYTNKSRRTMGQTQIEQKLKGLQTRLEKATQEKQAAQDELAKITSSNGYASIMYRQQRVLNDFVYGRTQDEVRGAVDRLEKSAANIAKRIEEEQRKAEEQAKNSVVQRFREILGTSTVDQTASALKKRYNSTWTKNQLKVYLEPIILKMKTGEDFESDVETLAGILVNSDSTNTYEELSGLRGLVITLGPGAQQELRAQGSSLKEIRARLAGTGIQVKFGERSSLESDIEDLRAEYPSIPELGDEKDALENFVSWVEGMKSQSAANEFYEQRIAEAMAVITQQAAGAAKGIYMPTDPKAAKQVLAMMEFVKGLNAETQAAQKMLQDVAKDMEELQKAGRQASGMAVTLTHDATTAIDYFNRMARIAEDQAKQKTRKDLIEQLKSDFAQKVAKNNEEWRNLIERDAQARKQAEKNMSSRGQINTVVKRLYDLLKNPKGTRNIPEHMQGLAREIVGVIVENDLSEMKHKISRIDKKNLMEAQRVLQAWEARDGKFDMSDLLNMDPENASMLVINQDLEQIYDGIEKFNQEIRGKNKLDTLQQRGEILTQIQEAMSEIYTAIRAEGEVFLRGRKVATEDAAAEVMNGTGGKKYREWTGTAGRALAGMHKAIVSGNMTPEYFFRTIGNKGLNDLWENYHAAENRNGLELAKAKARMDEIAKKYGYDKWDTKERRTVHLMNGDVQMTLGQIMALWATWNRENTLGPEMSNHLTGGGFYVEQQDLRNGLLGRTAVEKKAIKLAETDVETGYNPDVAAIESMMTQEQKDYVNDIVQFMSSDMSELGNEASMAAYGIRMYKEKYYFPFQMWDGIKSRKSNEAAQGANVDRAFHPSFSKSRMHGANNALVIGDFTQTAADHIAGMINYATMGLANESLQKVLNQQVQEGGELDQTKRNIRVILEEAYGQEATQYLLELQRQLNGGAVRTSKSLGDKAISLFRKNAVAGSLSVALQQPLSYIRAAMMVNPKYLAAALNPATWKGSYQEMMAHSGVAVIKDMGRFDMNAGQSAREYLTPDELEGKAAKIWGQITDKATILPEMMDRMTWTRMWSACKAEQAAQHPEMDVKSDEFLDMVGVRFNDLMRRTQVYDSVLVKSANMRSDNYWVKSLTSFMAEPTLTLNVLADAMREAKSGTKGGKALLAKAGATFILSAVMQAFFKGIMGSGRNPDEKKTWDENFLYRFWSNFINEADPVQLIPGYNDLVTLLKDGELEDDAMGALGKLFTAGKGTIDVLLGNGDKGVYRDLEDSVGQLVQLFTNLPAKNIMRDARAMYNFIAQPYAKRPTSASVLLNQTKDVAANADNMLGVINKWLGDAGYQTSNTAYYKRIYQAKKEGNEQAAQSMIDYLLTGKGVTEKAISSGINSAAKKDESARAAETADFLINEGSTSADDYVTDQLKAGSITAEEARKLLKQADPEKLDDDIWWAVDRIEYQKKTGAESISGKYYRLWDAMDANKADEIGDAVRIMTSHGVDAKNIKGQIGSHYKQAYLDGDSTAKRTIRDAMQKAYRKLGFTAEDANKTISNWEKKK